MARGRGMDGKYSQQFQFHLQIIVKSPHNLGTVKHKTSFCFSELWSTGGRVLLNDDGLAAWAHVAVDLVTDLDPKLSLIPEMRQLTLIF